ncbi:MAG: nitroreductase family protein [Candidatus Marinimicrobia bacterium]|nr:nitroreductase family protein [Candidatus Neomarinimicrobiota bacterium]
MNFLELVQKRQSTRKYSSRPVDRKLIDQCIEAARLAPSARNTQPWSFIVIDDPKRIAELSEKAFSGIYKSTGFAGEAPVLIVVITKKTDYITRLGAQIRNVKYSLIDIGIACEHLILQAEELGLGTCWLGWFNAKQVKKVLKLPRSTQIDILISLGYPHESTKQRRKQRRSLNEIRRYNENSF